MCGRGVAMTLTSVLGIGLHAGKPGGVAQKRKEQGVSRFIPYTAHYDEATLLTADDQLVQIIRLEGLPFQTIDDDALRRQKLFRNRLLRSLARSDLGVTVHVVRRKHFTFPEAAFPNRFCTELDAAWRHKHEQTEHYVNEIYLSLVKLPYKSGVLVGAKDRLAYLAHKRYRE